MLLKVFRVLGCSAVAVVLLVLELFLAFLLAAWVLQQDPDLGQWGLGLLGLLGLQALLVGLLVAGLLVLGLLALGPLEAREGWGPLEEVEEE